ncbi:MAG: hypothetical protein ABIH87_01970 [bacterium]
MPPLEILLPSLPWETLEIIISVVAGLGAILITYGIFLKTEKRQDIILFMGAFGLLIYALYIGNVLFAVAMTGLMLASFIEFIEILIGLHKDLGGK